MPELPEVEVIRKQLSGTTPFFIEEASYSDKIESILKQKSFDPINKYIFNIQRYGKMLDFQLEGRTHIISHLGMSGGWRLSSKKSSRKHTHLQFKGHQKNGGPLYLSYIDPRRFGKIRYLLNDEFNTYRLRLGVDVSSQDFNQDYVYSLFKRYPFRKIKPFLLDQAYFAGVGNYLACEICAHGGIRPTRRVGRITKMECRKIVAAVKMILVDQVEQRGLTFSGGHFDVFGNKGEGLSRLVVFHQKICGLCRQRPVKKIVLSGRGTFYCPACQK